MRDGLIITAISLLPRKRLSRLMGRTASRALSRHLIRAFVWWYGVDITELDRPLAAFDTLQAFFTRPLLPGARPLDDAVLVSPADGTLAWCGTVQQGRFQQSEQHLGDASTLLGEGAERWEGHSAAVVYLSPRDYHRVHAPCAGRVVRLEHVPGTLWPVFAAATRKVPGLFEGNERLIVELETARGAVAAVLVGALGVGEVTTGLEVGQSVAAGEEIGCFGFGSTVILFSPPLEWRRAAGDAVRVGVGLGLG